MANRISGKRPASGRPHEFVYGFIVALAGWMVLSAWGFAFIGSGAGLLLAVVSALIFFVVALSGWLRRIWRKSGAMNPADVRPSVIDWLSGEFDTHTGPVRGSRATVEIILPIAAVAIGLTVFAIVAIAA